jgi:hypothetical protein
MIGEINIERALDFIRDEAVNYGKAKADRVYLEQFRKTKKALLMNEKEGAQHIRESYAYAHPDYKDVLKGIQAAIEREEELKWKITAAQLKVEVWRTQRYVEGRVDKAHR